MFRYIKYLIENRLIHFNRTVSVKDVLQKVLYYANRVVIYCNKPLKFISITVTENAFKDIGSKFTKILNHSE